jgi:MFS family permease
MTEATTYAELVSNMIVLGAGLGTTFPIFTVVVQAAFAPGVLGVATASVQMFRTVGGTVGTAFLGGLLNYYMTSQHASFTEALTSVYFVAFFVMLGALVAVLFLPQIHLRHDEEERSLEEMAKEFEETFGLQR